MAQLIKYIASGIDDVFTTSGTLGFTFNHSEAYLQCGYHSALSARYYPGYRFINVNVSHLAQIDSASLTVNVSVCNGSVDFNFYGDDVDNAPQWAEGDQPYQITKTSATKFVNIFKTSSTTSVVTNIIQEIIDRSNWKAGNAIRLAGFPSGTPSGNNTFNVRSYEYGSNFAHLNINYTLPSKNNDISLIIEGISDIQMSSNLYIGGCEPYPNPRLYFNLWFDQQLRRIDIDNFNQVNILDIGFSQNIAINKSEQRIYITSTSDGLRKCDFIGDNLITIASGVGLTNPHGLTVSEKMGKIYWSHRASNSMIYNCNLDGSNKQIIIPTSSGLDFVSDLFADDISHKLYWTDKNAITISRANLDGTDIEVILSGTILFPMGIWVDGYGERIYFTDESNSGTLYSCNLVGSNLQIVVSGFTSEPRELTINQISNYAFVNDTQGRIFKIKLDGTDTQIFLNNISGILDIAIDPAEFIPLYIHGHESFAISGDLLIGGHLDKSNLSNLFIHGDEDIIISNNLFIHGHIDSVSSSDLFTWSHIDTSASGDLWVDGYLDKSIFNDLFIYGNDNIDIFDDLFIHGHDTIGGGSGEFIHLRS